MSEPGWAEAATKRDLEELASFREEFARQTRTLVFSFAMMFIGLVGLVLGVHFA